LSGGGLKSEQLSDEELVALVRTGNGSVFEILMRRYNQRLYRCVLSIVHKESDAEDIVQEALVRAYTHLDQFEGKAKFSTWLTKIAIYEAYARMRDQNREEELNRSTVDVERVRSDGNTPEQSVYSQELKSLLERVIKQLPPSYSSVFMLRDIEQLSTAEVAECLGISEQNVKVRLHRARLVLRKAIQSEAGPLLQSVFSFAGEKCDRIVAGVWTRIR
jgi:RNA polymerase sigma-70 factor (ECF subfamily)